MSKSKSFLQDLDEAISRGTPESRARALWHATDLLIAGRYSDDEIWTFGEVIGRLADEIEVAARAQLAKRLARTDHAPANIIRKLAFDDSIDVAGRSCARPANSMPRLWLPTRGPKVSGICSRSRNENPSRKRSRTCS
jgi:hypothetical protein